MGLKKKVVAGAERLTDVPFTVATGAPVVQIEGYHRITVENHRGIVAYEPEHIDVACSDSTLRICGEGLEIRSMDGTILVITGNVFSVEHRFAEEVR